MGFAMAVLTVVAVTAGVNGAGGAAVAMVATAALWAPASSSCTLGSTTTGLVGMAAPPAADKDGVLLMLVLLGQVGSGRGVDENCSAPIGATKTGWRLG